MDLPKTKAFWIGIGMYKEKCGLVSAIGALLNPKVYAGFYALYVDWKYPRAR